MEVSKLDWNLILTAAGVSSMVLDGKHHPCPACGGKDRFRFDNLNGRGTWFCNQCGGKDGNGGGGDGPALLQRVLKTDYQGAIAHINEVSGIEYKAKTPLKPKTPRPQSHKQLGEPSAVWEYTDRHGTPVFWVYRFDKTDGKKEFRPLHWNGNEWSWKAPGKLPLYHLDRIHANPETPLLFCEGEKAADAAVELFPEHVCTTTAHGAQSPGKSDFSPVKGRVCLIWPDNDGPGMKYAEKLAELLYAAGAAQIEILQIPEGIAEKWDAADAVAEGIKPEVVREWARRPWKPTEEIISITDARLSDMSDKGLEALKARNIPAFIFVQRGRLIRLTHSKGEEGGLFLNLIPLDAATLKHELERAALWIREGRKNERIPTAPPDKVCNDILAMHDYEGFPLLSRVVTAPCISPQGNVIDKPCFNQASGIYYYQPEPLEVQDTTPTPENVQWALSLIFDNWLVDFPFDLDCPVPDDANGNPQESTDSSSKAHALALFLLPFARGLINGVTPLHFVTAPTQRTGKTLLIEVVCGVFDPLVSPGAAPEGRDNDAEWRKKITAMLQTESPFFWIDNIKGKVDTAALEAALTSLHWSDRALGSHKQLTLHNNKVWVFTGNNAELSQDLYGRAVEIRLDSNLENPSERKDFQIPDIRHWTRQHRGELCAAALILIRNWLEQGKPKPAEGTPYLGGFEAWWRVMGGVLSAAGVQGFLMNRQATKSRVNSTEDIFKAFVEKWALEHGAHSVPLPAKDLREIARETGLFEEALASNNEAGELRRLGRWLTQNTDRVLCGYKIRKGKTAKGNNGYWLQPVTAEN